MRPLTLFLLLLASVAVAGFLPLIHDRPKRDNPYDPAVRPQTLPVVVFPTPTGCGGPDSGYAFATFESGADGFVVDTCCGFVPMTVANSSSTVCRGGQAYCGTANIVHSGAYKQVVFKKSYGTPQNWSGRTLHAWAYASPGFSGASVQIYIKSNGFFYSNGYAANPPAAGGWFPVSFDLSQTPNYMDAAVTNTAAVSEVGLQLYSNATDPDGTLDFCMDEFSLLGGPTPTISPTFSASPTIAIGTPTASPTASPTPSPTPGCGGPDSGAAFATFESSADGFVDDTCCTNFVALSPALSASTFCKGGQSLCGSATITHAGNFKQVVFKKNISATDWSGKTLTAWGYFSAGFDLASAQIYIKTTGAYVYSNGPITHPPAAGGWAQVSFDLSQPPNFAAGVTDTTQVVEVGMQVYSNASDPDGTLQFCIDEFAVQ